MYSKEKETVHIGAGRAGTAAQTMQLMRNTFAFFDTCPIPHSLLLSIRTLHTCGLARLGGFAEQRWRAAAPQQQLCAPPLEHVQTFDDNSHGSPFPRPLPPPRDARHMWRNQGRPLDAEPAGLHLSKLRLYCWQGVSAEVAVVCQRALQRLQGTLRQPQQRAGLRHGQPKGGGTSGRAAGLQQLSPQRTRCSGSRARCTSHSSGPAGRRGDMQREASGPGTAGGRWSSCTARV